MISPWPQEVEVGRCHLQPPGPRVGGVVLGAGCLRLTDLLTWHLASLPEDLQVTMLAPDSPTEGELRTSLFLKVTSLTVLDAVSRKLRWLLRIC